MENKHLKLFRRFVSHGVLYREEVKNDISSLQQLVRRGFVQKAFRQGRVFYELTEKALPLLESERRRLLEEVTLLAHMTQNPLYFALLRNPRFVDETNAEADAFFFLGDWNLLHPVVASQLMLAKFRFYEYHVSRRRRRMRGE